MIPLPTVYHFLLCFTTLIFDLFVSIRLAPDERALQIALLRQQLRVLERKIKKKPRLLTDNGSSFLHADFEAYLKRAKMPHIGTAPHQPTAGKIERFHLSSKNRLLYIFATPERLELAIRKRVEYYNHVRYHQALSNVTPADVYFGRQAQILTRRQQLKLATIGRRKAVVISSANR